MIVAGSAPPGRVAVLHAHPERAQELARILRGAGHEVIVIRAAMTGTDVVQFAPDVIVGSLTFRDLEPLIGFARAALSSPERKVSQEDTLRVPIFEGQVKRQVFEVKEFPV